MRWLESLSQSQSLKAQCRGQTRHGVCLWWLYLEMAPLRWNEFLELQPCGSRAATLCSSEEVSSQTDGTLRRTQKPTFYLFIYYFIFFKEKLLWSLQMTNKVEYAWLHEYERPSPAQNALSPLDLLLQGGPHGQIVRRALPLCRLARHLLQLCGANTHAPASFVVTCSPLRSCALHAFSGGSRGKCFT